jgi:hypothetical protein
MKKFQCKLNGIDPEKLIDKNNTQDIDTFFLVLGLIFNDLKGLVLFDRTIIETYERPEVNEATAHAGEHAGIRYQIIRLLIGLVSEFSTFLKINKKTIESVSFQLLLKSLDTKDRNIWDQFISPSNKDTDLFAKLSRIRSNIVFHYDHSGEELKRSFINKFFYQEKDVTNKKAYFSLGSNMETTRFFYCDAAAQDFLKERLDIETEDKDHYLSDFLDKIDKMNSVVGNLIRVYLNRKMET